MSRRPEMPFSRPLGRRLLGVAALACALAALGCNKSPLAWTLDFAPPLTLAGKSAAPNAVAVTPTPRITATAFPTIGTDTPPPASVAPTATTGAASPDAALLTDAIAPTDPLPSASIDSDLAADEQQAVEELLTSDDVLAFLPSELIHDGGVVLYRTLAADDVRRQTGPEQPINRPLGPPPPWVRADGGRSGALVTLRQDCPPGEDCTQGQRPVRATVRYQQKGTFQYRGPEGLISKTFGALFSRVMVLKHDDGKYALDQVSPIAVTTTGGRRNLEIAQLSFFGKPPQPLYVAQRADLTIPLDHQPRVVGGDRARVEVDLVNRELGSAFVFLSQLGRGPTGRIQLLDDGRGVDRVAGDGRFSGEFVVPNRPGVQHAVIDVIDPRSFLENHPFRSNSLGISYRVDVREF